MSFRHRRKAGTFRGSSPSVISATDTLKFLSTPCYSEFIPASSPSGVPIAAPGTRRVSAPGPETAVPPPGGR